MREFESMENLVDHCKCCDCDENSENLTLSAPSWFCKLKKQHSRGSKKRDMERFGFKSVSRDDYLEKVAAESRAWEEINESSEANRGKQKYKNWFENPAEWKQIHEALRTNRFSYRKTADYLKVKYNRPGTENPFKSLNESTIRGWFTERGVFKPKIQNIISDPLYSGVVDLGLKLLPGVAGPNPPDVHTKLQRGPGKLGEWGPSAWASAPDLEGRFMELIHAQRESGVIINSTVVQYLLRGFLLAHNPEILIEKGGPFSCSLRWIRNWLQIRMGWSFRSGTTKASKLPLDYEEQGRRMTLRIAFLVAAHRVPEELVVNMDQTGIRLLAISNERTYALKGSRDVAVCGRDDKRVVTVCVASSVAGYLLPFQVIFQGKTDAVVPRSEVATTLKEKGWHLNHTANHWSTLQSCKDWVKKIFKVYYACFCEAKHLVVGEQKLILLIDCWSVHRSQEFLAWLGETQPWIKLVFVPAGCTSVFQPADVMLQRPLKAEFTKAFAIWCTEQIQVGISAGVRPINTQLDFSIRKLRETTLNGLLLAHQHVGAKQEMIRDGWRKCGLGEICHPHLQAEAIRMNCGGELLEDRAFVTAVEPETEPIDDLPMEVEWNVLNYESMVSQALAKLRIADANPFDFRGRSTRSGPSQFTEYLTDPNLESPWV
ncbi:hypothetical protein R1sor_018353 [Riccia sorocarpa]|uniref:DDE-1 domain-containing protein n=1 Tax=Riccia sorocarpa TaxID=122646 RepID=A0ABD3IDI9_9MARC